MDYASIKKIDEESLQNLQEGSGPIDECLCSLLSPPEDERPSFRRSIKNALASIGQRKKKLLAGRSVDIPLAVIQEDGKGWKHSKEVVKRKSTCGKCGCDNENVVLKHSYANIRITSPDVSSICPCSSNCLPDKDKFQNNIEVTIERVECDSSVNRSLKPGHKGMSSSPVQESRPMEDTISGGEVNS
ncbi:hypothetical protein K1T71_014673 [Dendrolimus kikuchii]|uniref:Uncharacterized protein n=1 Tax=Dendrolimus kikuchii TaxID=765133 RepID=A0ACC1CEY5_9NEOP|nr:hypothetical protein K1T71_014673 [Dendrolimus kikuchii]